MNRCTVFAVVFAVTLGTLRCGRPAPKAEAKPEVVPAAKTESKPVNPAMLVPVGYDDKVDPAKELAELIPRAKADHKRILLVVGGEWCVWCHYLHIFLNKNADVKAAWDGAFETLHVNWSDENPNTAFLSKYPKIPGYPHIFVLDQDGTFIHSQGTEVLESGRGYSKDAVLAFLKQWS